MAPPASAPRRVLRAVGALASLLGVLRLSPAFAQDLSDLCAPRSPGAGPDWILAAELGAGANASISPARPWRFSARVTPTWIVDRRRGWALGAMLGGTSAQPAAFLVGPRLSIRLKSLVNLTGFRLPGADLQGALEYGYLIGGDRAHSLAATVGLDLVDLLRISVRGQHVFPYSAGSGHVRGQSVFELALGRSFTLHTPPPPALPTVDPSPTAGFILGRTEALATTITLGQAATDSTPSSPSRCNDSAIAGLVGFVHFEAGSVRTRAELLTALRSRGLGVMASRIEQFFPPEPEAAAVAQIVAGIRSIFPR